MTKKRRIALVAGIIAILVVIALLVVFLPRAATNREQGQSIVIELESNPTTGFAWRSWSSGTGSVELTENEFLTTSGTSGVVGAPGTERFTFVATHAGDLKLEFEYEQGWTGGEEAYLATYLFTVDDNLHVTFLSKEIEPLGDVAEADLPEIPDPTIT